MSIIAQDWIAHHARISPAQEAIHDLASGRRFTFAEFDIRVTSGPVSAVTRRG